MDQLSQSAISNPTSNEIGFPSDRQSWLKQNANEYLAKGWTPYRLSPREKRPPGKKPANIVTVENVDKLFSSDNHNLGVLLGDQSDGLIDLDLDWPEARIVAEVIFRRSPRFGRSSALSSHRLVRCKDAKTILQFTLPSSVEDPRLPDAHKLTVLEVRGTGHHTMFPPSVHPNGEVVKWENDCSLPDMTWKQLKRNAGIAAFLAVCIRFWPNEGSRDVTAMALAGALLRAGLEVAQADYAIKFVAESANDEEAEKRCKAVQTAEKMADGSPVTSMTALVKLLGLPNDCVRTFHNWLETKDGAEPIHSEVKETAEDGRIILDLAAPREVAREFVRRAFSLNDDRTLVSYQDEYYSFDRGRYRTLETTALQRSLYEFLETAYRWSGNELKRIDPKKSNIDSIEHALRTLVLVEKDRLQPPCWISGDGPSPNELIVCRNGVLDLKSRNVLPHTARLFTLSALDIDYDPGAAEPARWLSFLSGIFPSDSETIETLQEIFGYLLTPQTRLQKAFMLVAPPRSGKGTIARVLEQLVGTRNYAGIHLGSLGETFGLEPLIGKMVAVVTDARLGSKSDKGALVEKVLSITGEDAVQVNRKNKSHWSGRLPIRFFIHTNEVPNLPDASGAFVGRFIVLTTDVSFVGREDHTLGEALAAELAGILRWSIQGWQRLADRGRFIQPGSATDVLDMFADVSSPLKAFVDEMCVLDSSLRCGKDAIFESWTRWNSEQGRSSFLSKDQFCMKLYAAFPHVKPTKGSRSEGRPPEFRGICPAADLPLQGDIAF